MAQRINVEGIQNLLDAIDSMPHPVKLVHLSIDLVFLEQALANIRKDTTNPVTVTEKPWSKLRG